MGQGPNFLREKDPAPIGQGRVQDEPKGLFSGQDLYPGRVIKVAVFFGDDPKGFHGLGPGSSALFPAEDFLYDGKTIPGEFSLYGLKIASIGPRRMPRSGKVRTPQGDGEIEQVLIGPIIGFKGKPPGNDRLDP
jgi:hypothetical protein